MGNSADTVSSITLTMANNVPGDAIAYFIGGINDCPDTDGDGIFDHLDIDADDDGITDLIEAQSTAAFTAPSGVDADQDGLDDAFDADVDPNTTTAQTSLGTAPVNSDAGAAVPDATPDYLDDDSDNDGRPDAAENGLGQGPVGPNDADTDGDGLKDVFEAAIDGNVDDGPLPAEGVTDVLAAPNGYLPDGGGDASTGTPTPLVNDLDFRDGNDDPVAGPDSGTTDEDTVLTVPAPGVTANDTDPDAGDVLTVAMVEGVAANVGQPVPGNSANPYGGGTFTVNADGSWSFDPGDDFQHLAAGDVATSQITYTVSDGNGGTDQTTVAVTVQGTNDGPIPIDPTQPVLDPTDPTDPNTGDPFDPDDPHAAPDDPGAYIPVQQGNDSEALTPLDLTPYFGDPDAGDTVTLSVLPGDLPSWLSFDPGTNTLSGTPSSSASQGGDPTNPGTYTIPVTATDGSGAAFTTNVTYTIANPAPVAVDDGLTTNEDTPLTVSLFDANGTTANDDDPDGDTIAITRVATGNDVTALAPVADQTGVGTSVPGDQGGTFIVQPDGQATFDPGDDFQSLGPNDTAVTSIVYQIDDGEGGTDQAVVAVTVQGVNDAPIPLDPTQPAIDPNNPPANTPFDPDDPHLPPGDPNAYLPSQDLVDAQTPPALDLNGYFGDPDNGDVVTISLDPTLLPPGLTFANGVVSGTLDASASQGGDPNLPGTYVVPVTASDPHGGTFTTTLTYTVTNPAPVAADDATVGDEDGPVIGNVIVPNGTPTGDADPDGDDLSVGAVATGNDPSVLAGLPTGTGIAIAVPGSTGGTFTVQPNGDFTFDPGDDFQSLGAGESATTQVVYLLSDGEGGTDTAVLTHTVTGVNDAPVPVDPTQPAIDPNNPPANTPHDPDDPHLPPSDPNDYIPQQPAMDGEPVPPFDLTPYFGDPDAPDAVTVSLDPNDLPPGLVWNPVTQTISGTPAPSASQGGDPRNPGTYVIPVTASDPNGGTFTTFVTYEVDNPGPWIDPLPDLSQFDGLPFQAPMTTSLGDPDGDDWSLTAFGLPAGLSMDPITGAISGTLAPDASFGGPAGDGVYPVTVMVDDGEGGTATVSFLFTALPMPAAIPPSDPGAPEAVALVTGTLPGPGEGDIVGNALDAIAPLGKNMGLDSGTPVTEAVNGVRPLGGNTGLDRGHPVTEAIRQQRELDRAIAERDGGLGEYAYHGADLTVAIALRDGEAVLRTSIQQGHLHLDLATFRTAAVDHWHVFLGDRSVPPSWITQPGGNLVLIEQVADVDFVDLDLEAHFADGGRAVVPVRIDLRSGEVFQDGTVREEGPSDTRAAIPLDRAVSQVANAAREATARLFRS